MLYREIIAVCSQIHTKHINTLCGQNEELLNVKTGGTYSNHLASKFSCITTHGLWSSCDVTPQPASNPRTLRQFPFPAEMSGSHIKSTMATYDSAGRHRASALGKTNLQNWL
jgi:hypothetical protein